MLDILSGTVVFVTIASFFLAMFMTKNYLSSRGKSQLFWSFGLWLFFVDALLEIVFAVGIKGQGLFDLYLFTVAVLVQLLSLGSLFLLKNALYNKAYSAFSVVFDAVLAISLILFPTGNILIGGVVAGVLPIAVVVSSSIISFPFENVLIIYIYHHGDCFKEECGYLSIKERYGSGA